MPQTADRTAAVTIESLRAAARVLEGVAMRTPLLDAPDLSARVGVPVALKCELLQPIGAFKIRGAYNALARLVGGRRRARRGHRLERQSRAGAGLRRARIRPPGGGGDAGIHPAGEGGRGAALRGRGGAGGRHPVGRAGGAGRGHRAGRGSGDDPAVRSSRRHRRAGHHRPRDPRAAARRRHHPGAGERRRPHLRHLGGRGGAGPGGGGHRRRAGGRRQAHAPRSPPERRGRSAHTESMADGLLSRSVGDPHLRSSCAAWCAGPSR